jgi:hypothetical protein
MTRYKERVPDVQGVINAMIKEGVIANANEIENDHIAFRTMGVANPRYKIAGEDFFALMVIQEEIIIFFLRRS